MPLSSKAAVLISEVAWMGSSASANHEWIELHNTGTAGVDVSGWILSDGMNLSIALSGTIPAGSYAVLERTSDDSASGAAFLLYTGAMVNTGATLVLTRADGGIEDQVAGGEGWQSIGGDNVTKETAQYTAGGWVTGAPTPGSTNSGTPKVNEGDSEEEEDEEGTPVQTVRSVSSRSEPVRLVLTDSMLALKIDAQKVGYVHQSISFEAQPSSVGKTVENSLVYQWNFGDGVVKFGKEPTHQFAYPGTYIVTVYGAFKRQEQLARHEITILPVALSITRNANGDVQINNDSPYEIDISGYLVKAEKSFTFPEYSIVLPNQTVTLPVLKIGRDTVDVYDSKRVLVAREGSKQSSEVSVSDGGLIYTSPEILSDAPVSHDVPLVLAPHVLKEQLSGFIRTAQASTISDTSESAPQASQIIATTTPSNVPKNAWPYLGLIAIIILGLIGTASKFTRNQTD